MTLKLLKLKEPHGDTVSEVAEAYLDGRELDEGTLDGMIIKISTADGKAKAEIVSEDQRAYLKSRRISVAKVEADALEFLEEADFISSDQSMKMMDVLPWDDDYAFPRGFHLEEETAGMKP